LQKRSGIGVFGEKLPPVELLPAKHKKQSPDPTKKDASKEEFGQRALAGGKLCDSLSCLLTLMESFDKNHSEMGIGSVVSQMHQKTVQFYWVNIVKQQVMGGGRLTLKDTLIQPMETALNQPTFLTQAQSLLGKVISEHTTQRSADGKSIINKDRQVAPKRMPLGARLAVNTHNMEGRFVESVKNARWLMSPLEAGDGHESIVEFQVQIKGRNQREYEDKWQGRQNWTDERLTTKLTKDDQQPVLLLPARWWPDTLPEFESGGWWPRVNPSQTSVVPSSRFHPYCLHLDLHLQHLMLVAVRMIHLMKIWILTMVTVIVTVTKTRMTVEVLFMQHVPWRTA